MPDKPMKLLFQHPHHADEISGVLTYITLMDAELQQWGIATQTVSTQCTPWGQRLRAIAHADIVHMNSNDLIFALACKILGKKIILKYHYLFYLSTHSTYEPMSFQERIKTELIHYLPKSHYPLKWKLHSLVKYARFATRLITACLVDRRIACSQFLAASYSFPWPIHTVYNPAPIVSHPPKTLNQLAQPYRFVYVGRLSPDKGVDLLLQATKSLHDRGATFQVLILGDGPAAADLKTLSHELGISDCVQFLGVCSHADVLSHLQSALALVVPSRWQEPAGYVTCEASSVQTCSIVAQVGGLPELATPYSLQFAQADSPALATALQTCLDDPTEALDRGRQAQQYVLETFSPSPIARQLLTLCQELQPGYELPQRTILKSH
jgi:glycogen synthase